MEYFGTDLTECGHYRWFLDGDVMIKNRANSLRFDDLPFHPENLTNNLVFGDVVFYQGGGYTVIGVSGSCKDSRQGTKSIFWIKELVTRKEMIKRILDNSLSLELLTKMPFDVRWEGE